MAVRQRCIDEALARAVVWRFLALGFAPPSPGPRQTASHRSDHRALAAALDLLGLPAFDPTRRDDLEERYDALFGHTLRGEVCLYETEYGNALIFQQAQELADLQGWYRAFGLARKAERPERADHIGVQCEFVGFLSRKEAYMLERGNERQVRRVRQAYGSFLVDHLGRFGLAVAVHLERADPGGFYGRLATLCRTFLAAECRRLEIRTGPLTLPLRPDHGDEAPAACGGEAACGPCLEGSDLSRQDGSPLSVITGE